VRRAATAAAESQKTPWRVLDRTQFAARLWLSVEDDPANRSLSDDYLDGLPRQNGVPPHRLQLFEGAMCMLMRNLDPKRGLVNNTKCIIKKIWGGGVTHSGRTAHKAIEVALVSI
jgi:hypothetical protein